MKKTQVTTADTRNTDVPLPNEETKAKTSKDNMDIIPLKLSVFLYKTTRFSKIEKTNTCQILSENVVLENQICRGENTNTKDRTKAREESAM